MASVRVGGIDVSVVGEPGPFRVTLGSREIEPGLYEVSFLMEADAPAVPKTVGLGWTFPAIDVIGMFRPSWGYDRALVPSWGGRTRSHATVNMPVVSLYSQSGGNRLTFAWSDALNVVDTRAGLSEETALFECDVTVFRVPAGPVARYAARLLIDARPVPYHAALQTVSDWWAAQPGYAPSTVPEAARLPMYSTWYSFHQALVVDDVVRQCELSKALGCEAVIVDDGWQTLDAKRGYAFTGDWEPERIPDMRGFVDRVHKAGMKFLLWYGVPQMGKNAKHFNQFKDKFLYFQPTHNCGYLDPRYPDVREYLISLYERHLRAWDLDGFKLDFVDSFTYPENEKQTGTAPGRDYESVAAGADRLLSDVMARLRAVRPDVMIEFRQAYVGPLMRTYGNMFRAGDCPNDAATNRVRTLDVRLLAGRGRAATATHSDMLMWNPAEPVEAAALQLAHVLFAVPQISVLIDRLPADHRAMLAFYLKYWRDNRNVLLDGDLRPLHPELLYPVVVAETAAKRVVAVYGDCVAPVGGAAPELHLVNGTRACRLVIEATAPLTGDLIVRDCTGRQVARRAFTCAAGVHAVQVPSAGIATITA